MKQASEVTPNYGPVYAAALYPQLARVLIDSGYALAVHGSLARDFDLIAVPWVESPASHDQVLDAITRTFAVEHIGEVGHREHGRTVYTLSVGFGECSVDLSFTPITEAQQTGGNDD